jgi:hypothetical protein
MSEDLLQRKISRLAEIMKQEKEEIHTSTYEKMESYREEGELIPQMKESANEEALELKIRKQERPSKFDLKSKTIETKKQRGQFEREREEEFYRLKNLQAHLSNKNNMSLGKKDSSDEEGKEVEYYTHWEKQINAQRNPNEVEQKRILADLLRQNSEPEVILEKSMNLNQKSMYLMSQKKSDSKKKEWGETAQMLEFCEKRIEKYSQEKEELWGKLNELMNDLEEKEEEVKEGRERENKWRKEKTILEDRISELQVEMGRQVQETQEKESELRKSEKEREEMEKTIEEERRRNGERNRELTEAVDKINREKQEIEKNAEEINKRNGELQDFIDNQEISLGRGN